MVYLIPFLAVVIGIAIAYILKPNSPKGMKLILSFSGAFLLGVLVLEMLPRVYQTNDDKTGIWILLGIILQILLEFFSKGAEHGHSHNHSSQELPWVLLISLCIHAFLEGLPLDYQIKLLWAVSIHKIPIGLVLGLLLFQVKGSLITKSFALLCFALMSPLGAYVGLHLDLNLIGKFIEPLIVGVLFHISTTILFESSEGHEFNLQKFLFILLGIGFAIIM